MNKGTMRKIEPFIFHTFRGKKKSEKSIYFKISNYRNNTTNIYVLIKIVLNILRKKSEENNMTSRSNTNKQQHQSQI